MNDILKFLSIFTFNQKREFCFIFFIMIVGAILESTGIGGILPLITLLGQPDYLVEHPDVAIIVGKLGIYNHVELIIATACLLVVFFVIKNIFVAVEMYIQRRFTMKNQTLYAKEILITYLLRPYAFHMNHNSARLLRDVSNGPSAVCNGILYSVFYMVTEIVTAIAIWIMLIIVDPFTAIVVAGIMLVIISSIIRIFRGKIVKQGKIQNDNSTEYLKWINQSLGAIKETKILRKEYFFLYEFTSKYKRYAKALQMNLFLADVPRVIIELLVIGALLVLIVVKLLLGGEPGAIIPVLGVLAMAAFRLMPSASRIVSQYNSIKNQMPFFYELYDVLMEIKSRLENGVCELSYDNDKKLPFNSNLRIEGVSFKYSDDKDYILDKISFDIQKGKFIGVIGPSGAGKTTFVDILLGLLGPTGGRILCDGQDINKNIRSWQANLAYVPQDIYLIDGSIRENIALGEKIENIDNRLIETVLDMAELHDYVRSLPNGLDTFVGERGVKISGGQRQRIGIARALYQKPEVLILDEATSALDNETEKSITDTVLKLKGKITILAIAHRMSTLENCDYKVRLENGKAEIIN